MASQTEQLLLRRNRSIPRGVFHVAPVFVREARGAVLIDVDGHDLIDFTGGIGVNTVGHAHPKVVAAIKEQAEKYIHTCFNVAMYEPYVALAEKLNDLAPGATPRPNDPGGCAAGGSEWNSPARPACGGRRWRDR